MFSILFFFQAEDGIRDLVRSRGLGDVYKRQADSRRAVTVRSGRLGTYCGLGAAIDAMAADSTRCCLLYTSDAADERSSVDLGGRRILKKKKK